MWISYYFFAHFQNFIKIKTLKHKFFKFWSFINLPWGHVRSNTKFRPNQFSRFDVYWIQTDKQTDRQTNRRISKVYLKVSRLYSLILRGYSFIYFVNESAADSLLKCGWVDKIRTSQTMKYLDVYFPHIYNHQESGMRLQS